MKELKAFVHTRRLDRGGVRLLGDLGEAVRTAYEGDGIVLVTPPECAIKIRTGEGGPAHLAATD